MSGPIRRSLFARTAATITVVSFAFFVFTLLLIGGFIVVPLAQRTADNLATLIVVTAHSWEQLSEPQWASFHQALGEEYRLKVELEPHATVPRTRHIPFFLLVERALAKRLGHAIKIQQADLAENNHEYWVKVPGKGGRDILVGFSYSHEDGIEPPLLLLLILVVGSFAILATSVVLARRLTRPLDRLAQAAQRIGSGEPLPPLPPSGTREIAELVRAFNEMNDQVRDLLANRTTLLAGISHDLRTPLTRMELALEMLGEGCDPTLVEPLKRDLQQMNRLIGLFLEISRGLQEERRSEVQIAPLLAEVVGDLRRQGADITLENGPTCSRVIHPLALRRIVNNLIENALRYGDGKPVTVRHEKRDGRVLIEVLDRGPGIPEDQSEAVFRPFHRLEKSRNIGTGGSGLGLSIVRQLAEANGCKVELLPREGGGTRARITLKGQAKSASR